MMQIGRYAVCASESVAFGLITHRSQLSIIVEYIAGKVPQTIDRLISLYRPDSIVVGTRGQRGMIQAWGAAFGAPGKLGSVSRRVL